MIKYTIKRVSLMILTIFIIIIVVFFLLRLVKGLPTAIQQQLSLTKDRNEQEAILASYDPEKNPFKAFGLYLQGVFKGDFGKYYNDTSKSIQEVFINPLKYTLMITGPSFLIGTFFGTVFGFISGYKRGKWPDITVNIIATLFVSIPMFVLAMFLLMFGNEVGLPISFSDAIKVNKTFLAAILPIVIISITSFSTLTYYIRNESIEVLSSDYVSVARAKGLSETQIFFKHVLRNVSLPFIAIVFPSFLTILFGSLIIEVIFGVPGSSSVFSFAIYNREKNVIMFSTIFFTSFGLILNLAVDLLYGIFDPRVTIGEKTRISFKEIIKSWLSRKEEKKRKEK